LNQPYIYIDPFPRNCNTHRWFVRPESDEMTMTLGSDDFLSSGVKATVIK
jgi:hypothetical protein